MATIGRYGCRRLLVHLEGHDVDFLSSRTPRIFAGTFPENLLSTLVMNVQRYTKMQKDHLRKLVIRSCGASCGSLVQGFFKCGGIVLSFLLFAIARPIPVLPTRQ